MHGPFRLVGSTIADKYRVDRVLGEGGFGVVYAGMQTLLGHPVAIKCMKPFAGSTAEIEHTVDVFMREARVLFSLTHPAIVRLYDVGVLTSGVDRIPYVVLELLEGTSLEKELERRARAGPHLSAGDLRAIFEPVFEAVAFAHERGIAHRDLKPANIMLVRDRELTAKVLDFGTALVGPPVQSSLRRTGFTPRYAAPEQWDAGHGPTGPHTDVFALGLTLAEACLTRPVFEGGAAQIISAALDPARRPRVSPARPDLPPGLDDVIQRALRVGTNERFANAREMLGAFRATMSQVAPGATTLASVPPQGARAATPPPPAPFTPSQAPVFPGGATTSSPLSRDPTQAMLTARTAPSSNTGATVAVVLALLAVAGAFIAVAIAGTGFFWMRRNAAPTVAPVATTTATPTAATTTATPPETATASPVATARPTAAPTGSLGSSPVPKADAGAPPPKPTPGAGSVVCTWAPGRAPHWTGGDMRDVFEVGRPGLEACYARARSIDPALDSHMGTLMIHVDKSGLVTDGTCHLTEHLNEPAEQAFCACAVHAATKWRFPASRAPAEKLEGALIYNFNLQK
jgi:serine/threonine protein kinase